MSDYDGGGALESVLAAAQGMFNNVPNDAPMRVEPWWELPLLLAFIVGSTAATIWMIRLERRDR